MVSKQDFGRVRQLPSGRWQARYPGPDGVDRPAPRTFDRKRDATDWLAEKRTELARGEWLDPDRGRVPFGEYAARSVNERDLSDTTRERYDQLRVHLLPTFGLRAVGEIREADVRTWRKDRRDAGVGQSTAAKAYRLLHAILHTAADDGLLRRNPCRVRGAGEEKSAERSVLSVDQVFDIADAIRPRFRCLVLLAAFTSLRFGEPAALRRTELDLDAGEVRVLRSQAELRGGRLLTKDPKSAAGLRVVAIPSAVVPELRSHVRWFSEPATDGLVFIGPLGGRLLRRNFRRLCAEAVRKVGLDPAGVHFHDLRHTGNNLAAATGASTKELMARMGHSSMRAALIYQHATRERDRKIADGLSEQIKAARRAPTTDTTDGADGHATGTGSASGA
jgi:integrase